MFGVTEYALDYYLTDNIRNHELMVEFCRKCEYLGLAIDDYTLTINKLLINDIRTEVISYAYSKGCSLQEAFDRQYDKCMDLYKQCNEILEKAANDKDLGSQQIRHYMDCWLDWGVSMYSWVADLYKYEVQSDGTIKCQYWDNLADRAFDGNFPELNYLTANQ